MVNQLRNFRLRKNYSHRYYSPKTQTQTHTFYITTLINSNKKQENKIYIELITFQNLTFNEVINQIIQIK